MCAEVCTVGAVPSCGWSGVGPADAFCFYSYQAVYDAGGPGAGDAGLCAKLCDCDAECGRPELGCIAGGATFYGLMKRAGYCSPPFDTNGQPVPTIKDCTDAGAGGASGTDGDSGAVDGSGGGGGAAGTGVADGGGTRGVSCGDGKVLVDGQCVAGPAAAAEKDEGGCGCRAIGKDVTSRGAVGLAGLALLLALARRRKAHKAS